MALLSILREALSRGGHLIAIGLLLAAGNSQGQNFGLPAAKCSSCHSSSSPTDGPPNVQTSTIDNPADCGNSTAIVGLGESFVGSSPAALSALRNRLSLHACGSSQMKTIADNSDTTDLQTVATYLLNLRDAVAVPPSPVPGFADTAIGSTRTVSTSFVLRNYRASPLTLTFSAPTNPRFSLSNVRSDCAGPATTVAATTSGITPTSCTVTLDITFSPIAADVPAAQSSATLTSNVSVNFAYNPVSPTATPAAVPQPTNSSTSQTIQVSAVAYRPAPIFTLNPAGGSSVAMSARINNATDTRTITIGNAAGATADLVNIRPSLTGSSQFSLRTSGAPAPACQSASGPFTLTAGSTCNLTLAFTPLQAGSSAGTLTVASDNAVSASLTLNGSGTQSIAVAPTTLDFGEVKKDAFKDLVLTVANSNTATAPLNLTGAPQKQGTAAGDYTVTANTCNSAVSQGGTCTVTIRFSPATSDGSARTATLTLPTDAAIPSGGLVTVGLTGKGTAQSAPTLSAPSLAFADTVIGETSPALTVTLTNLRTDALTYALSLPADFVEDSPACAGRVVAANGGTCVVSLRLRPQVAGGAGSRSGNATVTFTVPAGQTPPASLSLALSGNALMPLSASPTLLAPSSTLGASTLASATVVNRSASAVTLGAVTFSGDAAGDYTLDTTSVCRSGVTLGAGLSCPLVLRYAPSQTGTRNAALAIAHNASAGSPLTLALAGTVNIGQLSLSGSSVGFGDTALGSSAPASTLTLGNTGSAPLTLTGLSLGGTQAGDFVRGGTCAVNGVLAIGAQCSVTVQFQPTALGARNATLTLAHTGAAPTPVVLALTGNGIPQPAGVLVIDGSNPLDVGSQTINGLYGARTVRLRNTGTAALQLTGVAITGSAFRLDSTPACTSGTNLAIGQTCDLAVRFAPLLADTPYQATLAITHNAAGSPQTLTLTGLGTAAVVPVVTWVGSTEARDFGQQSVGGAASPAQTISLTNQGPGAIQFSLINTIGLDAAMFPVQGGAADACSLSTPLDAGKRCTVTLAFSPGTPGSHAARLQVISSGTALPLLSLTGTGLGPASGTTLGMTPAQLDFGSTATRVGAASLPMEVVLRADNQGAVRIAGWAVEGAFSVESRTCPPAPFTLAIGDQCALVVTFRPAAAGDSTGTLQITSSSGADMPATVQRLALSAKGQAAVDVVGGSDGGGGGGCSLARPDRRGHVDPTLLVLAVLAVLILWHRRRQPGPRRHDR